MRNIFLLFVLGILLTGCGSSDTSSTNGVINDGTHTLQIGNNSWEVKLPDGWKTIDAPKGTEALFIARRDSENFVIIQRETIPGSDPSEDIWNEAKSEFKYFNEVSFNKGAWAFQAKKDIAHPYRQVQQRILGIPNSRFFLLGSCSYEIASTQDSSCSQIMNSFKIQ